MKKLKLNLEKIEVDSFDAAGVKGRSGTVHAESYTFPSGIECETGRQDSCYSCPAPPYCAPREISWDGAC